MKKSLILRSAIALALATPLLASAESDIAIGNDTTAANGGAQADLNFRVVIPAFISLRIGTAGPNADTVEFALTDAQAAADGTVAATTNNNLSVALLSNVGNVAFSAAGAALTNTADNTQTIPLTAITITPTGTLAAPGFNATPITVAPTAGRVVNRSATWAFGYLHNGATGTVGEGTYETTVTYTASRP